MWLVINREQVTLELNVEAYKTEQGAKDRALDLRRHYYNAIVLEESDLKKLSDALANA